MQSSTASYGQKCFLCVNTEFGLNTVSQGGGGNIRAKGMINCSCFVLDKIKSLSVGMLHLQLFWGLLIRYVQVVAIGKKSAESLVLDVRQGIFNMLKLSKGDCQRQKWQPNALHTALPLIGLSWNFLPQHELCTLISPNWQEAAKFYVFCSSGVPNHCHSDGILLMLWFKFLNTDRNRHRNACLEALPLGSFVCEGNFPCMLPAACTTQICNL